MNEILDDIYPVGIDNDNLYEMNTDGYFYEEDYEEDSLEELDNDGDDDDMLYEDDDDGVEEKPNVVEEKPKAKRGRSQKIEHILVKNKRMRL